MTAAHLVNSRDTESYHTWSSNGQWIVFSSRRDDGEFTRLFFAHIDKNGHFRSLLSCPVPTLTTIVSS